MQDHEFDRILSGEGDLVPSSGFASAVMDAVRSEASAPPPIPFPWARALPGIAAGVIALVYLFIEVFRQAGNVTAAPSTLDKAFSSLAPAFREAQMVGAGWILAALALAYFCVKLSLLFARDRA
ncbi:MAG TPA: hypothetical protein VGN17_20145 [Bryobacteraceae bacterium]|jgi:hypothetical protein